MMKSEVWREIEMHLVDKLWSRTKLAREVTGL
jgi:hypothetical protein